MKMIVTIDGWVGLYSFTYILLYVKMFGLIRFELVYSVIVDCEFLLCNFMYNFPEFFDILFAFLGIFYFGALKSRASTIDV